MFTVAIVGRTSVGKSTLFNRLCGRAFAIVDSHPGVSRDRNESTGHIGPMKFKLIDTAGWENNSPRGSLGERMTKQSEIAIAEADVCLFMVDGLAGVTGLDRVMAQRLRVLGVPAILVINKCEARRAEKNIDGEFYKLGPKTIVRLSAEHGEGLNILYDALEPYQREYSEKTKNLNDFSGAEMDGTFREDAPLQLAIVGRPNVG
ncbi:MAG: GTP-binding protein, partial [Rickettsiales bacterium]|nr:GTP-binding protein [Rickettsiales bacterium]